MTTGLFDPDGGGDPTLTGVESRTLRALLQLERRHVAILAEQATGEAATTERVTQWERSKARGYPPALVVLMRDLDHACAELASDLVTAARGRGEGAEIVRPRGSGRIMTLLRLPGYGVRFSDDVMTQLDDNGGDFWQRLGDATAVRAAIALQRQVGTVHVAYDQEGAEAG